MSVAEFERELFAFVNSRRYTDLGWTRDKGVRDTGPYINGVYYGTHPAVRVYYSPEVTAWLEGGRRGAIPDGAVIIKEQFAPPAARHAGKSERELRESLESWTVMVKDSAGSHDGWFWSNPAAGQEVVDNHADFSHPISGFGMYCVRCHASTRSAGADPSSPENEFTFASLRNIEGYPGQPILFRVDDSWRRPTGDAVAGSDDDSASDEPGDGTHPSCTGSGGMTPCVATPNPDFVAFFSSMAPVERGDVQDLPPVTHDWVAKDKAGGSQQFVTAKQCMSCHAGLMEPYGPTMFVPTGESAAYGAPGRNISPHGEWAWTPMGLAGRDPVFMAQLESEKRMLANQFGDDPNEAARLSCVLEDTCLKCHGAMGRHEFHATGGRDGRDTFGLDLCEATTSPADPMGEGDARLGALARDGISCMVCHRMRRRPQPEGDDRPYLQYFLETSVTGNLYLGPPDEVYGPFKDEEITQYPMQHALGITPKHNEFLQSSQLCGVCHTVTLPAVDSPLDDHEGDELSDSQVAREFASFHHHVEQATYLEWLNSSFENEFNPNNPDAQTCQDCHMSRDLSDAEQGLAFETLATRMAVIQDTTYPDAENLAPHTDLDVRVREEGFARHNFSGLNLFLLELFEQFDDVLGVRTQDFMTGSKLEIENARRNFLQTAREKTADLDLSAAWQEDELVARVTVRNKAGHRFPTGVGFRRAFLELLVVELPDQPGGEERVVWGSGRTNSIGVIVDENGAPLPTEFFSDRPGQGQDHQPHHDVITSQNQVQIYESLLSNAEGRFTTSFLRGRHTIKDNRLLPKGWTPRGPSPDLTGRYLEATHPAGEAARDTQYLEGSGADRVAYQIKLPPGVDPSRVEVRATLNYQALPPYFLKNLFDTAPDGESTRRLYFMLSHADFEGTPIDDWKLMIATAAASPRPEAN